MSGLLTHAEAAQRLRRASAEGQDRDERNLEMSDTQTNEGIVEGLRLAEKQALQLRDTVQVSLDAETAAS